MKTLSVNPVHRPSRLVCALRLAGLVTVAALAAQNPALAQIRTDTSLGQSARTLVGPTYVIPQSLGKLSGNNLFHSFQTFNLDTNESANFTTTTAGLSNVISRVTGGTLSQINGLISLTAANATPNFFFINPAGVTFGAGASIDVPAAFHVSTANYLQFADGKFYADTSSASTFSSAEPAAFGFLGSSRASIQIKDSVLYNPSGGISLVAGDLSIDHAGLWTGTGDIRIAATGTGPTEVSLRGALASASGRLAMINGSYLYSGATAQSAGGNIVIAAGDASLQGGALVKTDSSSAGPAGSITAELGSLVIDGRSATSSTGIISLAAMDDVGAGGNVAVTARDTVRILGGGMITSDTYGLGDAGNVAVKAESLLLDGSGHAYAARISSRSGAVGNAGSVAVDVADSIVLSNASMITTDTFGAGQAGGISLRAGKDIQILTDSFVTSSAYSSGNAGSIDISAQTLMIDGTGGKLFTQVSSQALDGSQGTAGNIHITTPGALSVINGGRVNTSTSGSGNAGEILVNTGALLLDGRDSTLSTGIFSTADAFLDKNGVFVFNTGNAGTVNINVAGDAQILRSASVSSDTWSRGNGGDVIFQANNLLIDGMGSPVGAGIASEANAYSNEEAGFSGNGGSVVVDVTGHLQIAGLGYISTSTLTQGNSGPVSVTAGQLTIDGAKASIQSGAYQGSTGNGGPVSVMVAGDATIANGGYISGNTHGSGHASNIDMQVTGNLNIGNNGSIQSDTSGNGDAGSISVQVGGNMFVGVKGNIVTSTEGAGNGGNIGIQVGGNMNMDAKALIVSGTWGTGNGGSIGIQVAGNINIVDGTITSGSYGTGNGGSVGIQVAGNMNIDSDGYIGSLTTGVGNSGNIGIQVSGKLDIGSGARIASNTLGSGAAGNLDISASQLAMAGGEYRQFAWIVSDSQGSGAAGRVDVNASKSIELAENSWITSDARDSGHAGTVSVSAPDIRIGGAGLSQGAGISSSAFSTGNAGRVEVNAQTLTVMGGNTLYPNGIQSQSGKDASGNAGTVVINVSGALQVLEGGAIASSTELSGRGGEVLVKAGSIEVNGEGSQIGAAAKATSSGQPGNVSVHADGALVVASGGSLSIQNDGTSAQPSSVSPSLLSVEAAQLILIDAGAIKANATGNVAAGTLQINVSDRLSLHDSSITTSANSGDGGPISIHAGQVVDLNRSQITTSVLGSVGSGGDIHIAAGALALNSGFIQANTAASNASGGLVDIEVKNLVASGNTLWVGGQLPLDFAPDIFGFNVIQAAAPTGVSGAIDITSPVLDVSGSLRGLDAQVMDAGGLGRNPCQTSGGSSLVQIGRGGLPPSGRGLLRGEPFAAPALDPMDPLAWSGSEKTNPVWLRTGSCQ